MTIINNIIKLKERRKHLRKEMTKAEIYLWGILKSKKLMGFKFRRQHSLGRYIVDFYCPELKMVIEVDGGQHDEPENLVYDQERTKYLNSLGIAVVRYWNNEVLQNIEGVFEGLEQEIKRLIKVKNE